MTTRYTIAQFMHTTRVSGLSFSHDETSILFTSNQTGISNAFSIPVTGGPARQLTYSTDDHIRAISFFPHDDRLIYARDKGGIESHHLCVLEQSGKEIDITPGVGTKAGLRRWSRDGKSFYCLTSERNPSLFDVYKVDAASYERTLMFTGNPDYDFFDLSEDEKYAVFIRHNATNDTDICLWNGEAQEMHVLTRHDDEINFHPAYFDMAHRYLYYLKNEGDGLTHVYRYELESGKTEWLGTAKGEIGKTCLSYNGKYRVVVANEGVRARIAIYEQSTGTPLFLPSFPGGDIKSVVVSKSESLMGFYVNGDRIPNDLYVYEFETQQTRKLTNCLNPEIDSAVLVESQEISFRAFDGMEIPGLLWKPHNANQRSQAPALVWVHGGPVGQIRKGYAGAVQYLVNHGYVVLGVNHRGSSGYGKSFSIAADRRQGREPLWDCIEAKRYLAALEFVDRERIGIIGGSFGGYMTLAALAFHPEEFAAGVDICGVSNWLRALSLMHPESSSGKLYFEKIGNPNSDQEMLRSISPFFHAGNIKKPLMVIQGAKDPRVTRAESDDIVGAVRAAGGIVEYLVFEDEAHGFRKRKNAICAYEEILRFLDRYLKRSVNG